MNIYSWEDDSTCGTEKQFISIVVAHVVSFYIHRHDWDRDCKEPYSLNIQTKERCFQRYFKTFKEAKIEYGNLRSRIEDEQE